MDVIIRGPCLDINNGLLIQWGILRSVQTPQSYLIEISLPVSYSNVSYIVQLTARNINTPANYWVNLYPQRKNISKFTITVSENGVTATTLFLTIGA